jgi:flagellar hook-associated protein 1 FlgK
VANKPEELALRYTLRETAVTLTDTLRENAQRLQSVRLAMDVGIGARVEEVNALARDIAEYSRQISVAQAEHRAANDLRDRRDLLLDRLAALSGAMPYNSEGGHLIVYLDGRPLIQGASSFALSVTTTEAGVEIRSSYDDAVVRVESGEIGGLLYARDTAIPGYLEQLDTLARTLVSEVNSRHQAGFGLDDVSGRDFFAAGSGAGDIVLDGAVLADVHAMAAAGAAGAPGDGSVALSIGNLRTTQVLGGRTLNQLAQSLVGAVANDIASSDARVTASRAALDQIRGQQQSVAGVSIDEELAYLTESQRAYEAAARVIVAADEMIRTIIERLGVS